MNTWIVGRHPVAYEHRAPIYRDAKATETAADGDRGRVLKRYGQKVFYLKGRIMAGQADLVDNEYGATDFKWLTKEELKEELQPGLYESVEISMPAR